MAAAFQDATALAEAVRAGDVSASSLMAAAIERARARADLGALRLLDAEMGTAAAAAWDGLLRRRSRRALGAPFSGLPFLMKDIGNAAAGLPVAASTPALISRLPADSPAGNDSLLARRFRRAGLIPFGITTTPELALSLSCEPPGLPAARNPWAPDSLSPGGSSGGAAAAVAAGIVAIAHATDACGSIRAPAAACGLYGLKPTRGATPNGPTFANDLLGLVGELVLARSARDVRTALAAAAGDAAGPCPDPFIEPAPARPAPLRIGVVDAAPGIAAIADDEARAVRDAAAELERLGHRLVAVDAAVVAAWAETAMTIAVLVLSVSLADWLAALGVASQEISPLAAAIRARGAATPATSLFAAQRQAAVLAHSLWRRFETVDALLTPALAAGAPPLGAFPTDTADVDGHFRRMLATAPYMALANVGGLPALALPFGRGGTGLPVGLQLLGPMGADLRLLALAEALAVVRPPVFPAPIAGFPA